MGLANTKTLALNTLSPCFYWANQGFCWYNLTNITFPGTQKHNFGSNYSALRPKPGQRTHI